MNETADVEGIAATETVVRPAPDRGLQNRAPELRASGGRAMAIIPRTFDEAFRIGKAAVVGKWAPKGWTQEQATLAIMHGAEVGLPPMMSLQKICVINGRPSLWGDAVPAIALATGQLEDWEEGIRGEGDAMEAFCRVKRRGIRTPVVKTFSVADAKKADLWDERPKVRKQVWENQQKVWKENQDNDSPWYRYPKRMLQMRARVAFRDAFADAFSGLYIAEELQGHEMRDVTPGADFEQVANPLRDDDEGPVRQLHEDGAAPANVTAQPGAAPKVMTVRGMADGSLTFGGLHTGPSGTGTVTVEVGPDGIAKGMPSGTIVTPTEPQDAPAAGGQPDSPLPPKANGWPRTAAGGAIEADQVTLGKPVRCGGPQYLAHLTKWCDLAPDADYIAKRFKDETALRNNLGTPLTDDERQLAAAIRNAAIDRFKAR